uniref:Methyltranfer_dom domain-containing protein n=1 Tax=Panagrellus redivivus TaxID=6233 RepID=A0A7E4UW20_PANRE
MDPETVAYVTTALEQCKLLADMYMIDYFVDNLWQQLPKSWQSFYESQLAVVAGDRTAIVALAKHILKRPSEVSSIRLTSPEPLSMLALKAVVGNVELKQWAPISKPSEALSAVGLPSLLESRDFTDLKKALPPALRLKIKPKKEHEVSRIADVAGLLIDALPKAKINEIVDVGAGIGHLSRVLSLLLPNQKVSTIEGDAVLVDTAAKLDEKTAKSIEFLTRRKQIEPTSSGWNPLDRKAVYVKEEHEINESRGSNMLLTGLHTCGDFSATILRHFCSNSDAKVLLHFGCCYHKLNNGADKLFKDVYEDKPLVECSKGFPLSKAFGHMKLTYAAREVACFGHEQFIQKLEDSISKKSFFVNCYRSILEWVILECPKPGKGTVDSTLRHQGLRGFRGAEAMDFWQYAEEAMRDKPQVKAKFEQILTEKPHLREEIPKMSTSEAGKTLLLYTFRLLIAPMIEALILLDRVAFLRESGCLQAALVPMFDPMLSPRNVALIAWKDFA